MSPGPAGPCKSPHSPRFDRVSIWHVSRAVAGAFTTATRGAHMTGFRTFLKSGHAPTLFASFFYFAFSCCVWVMNGAMAPFISDTYQLSPAQKGVMLSIPIFAGAFMRFPLGLLAQSIGRKNATLVEMGLIMAALLFGYFFVDSYGSLLAMGVLLGIAGASFGVAMSLGSGSFPARHKGLAMGLVGAGNVGTAVSVLVAPALAQRYGWHAVYGIAAMAMLLPVAVMIFLASEPDDGKARVSLRQHASCLCELDGWVFSLVYAVTFGGFIGLTTFLPSYYHDQFGVSKVQAGQLAMLAAFIGAAVRIAGGWISDHWGGVNTLTAVLLTVAATLVLCSMAGGSLVATTLLFLLCFAALGAGNGALFQLVPLRWPASTAVAGSMIGEIGALGGGLVPNAMGLAKQGLGGYGWGFVLFALLSLLMLSVLRAMQGRWTRRWAEAGGRARASIAAPG